MTGRMRTGATVYRNGAAAVVGWVGIDAKWWPNGSGSPP
jgi:hypothetical protein